MALNILSIREKPGMGHNSGAKTKGEELQENRALKPEDLKDESNPAGRRLLSFVQRIERMEEEKKAIGEDIRDVFSESKAVGFEPKIIRWLIGERKVAREVRQERDELRDLYWQQVENAEQPEE